MSEKEPAFVVVDRRKYTADGEIRETYTAPPAELELFPPVKPLTGPQPVGSAFADTVSAGTGSANAVSANTGSANTGSAGTVSAVPEAAAANVISMSARSTVEADDFGAAEENREEGLRDEEQAGAGFDVDGEGLPSDDEAAALLDDEGEDEDTAPAPTSAEIASQQSAYKKSAGAMDALLLQANPGMKVTAPVGLEHIVQSFYMSAIMAMGAGTEPGQKPRIDILGARQSIDMLSVLADKTRGNLDDKEQRLVDGVAFELRMMFLELTNAIAAQAQAPQGRK